MGNRNANNRFVCAFMYSCICPLILMILNRLSITNNFILQVKNFVDSVPSHFYKPELENG